MGWLVWLAGEAAGKAVGKAGWCGWPVRLPVGLLERNLPVSLAYKTIR